MQPSPYKGDFSIGERVIAFSHQGEEIWRGEIAAISSRISIMRDDRITGGGVRIEGYGTTWQVRRVLGRNFWSSDGGSSTDGFIIPEVIRSWKELIEIEPSLKK